MSIAQVFKNYRKLVAFFAAIVVFLGAFTIAQYQAIQDRRVSLNSAIMQIKDLEWNYVWETSIALRRQASEKATGFTTKIKSDISSYYGDNKASLSYDLSHLDNNNNPIVNIFAKNILGTFLNGISTDANDPWIGTRTQIVSDFSVDCSANGGRTRSYEKEVTLHYNKLLAKKAIDKLLEVNTELPLIGWQFRAPSNPKWTINDFTEENLRDLFFKYGFDSLDSFEWCNAAYIDNKVDLLGKYLVDSHGQQHPNNQFIVNQGFNLVEQMKAMPGAMENLDKYDNTLRLIKERANWEIVFMEYTLLIVFAVMLVIFILGSVLLNKEAVNIMESAVREESCKED